MLHTCKYVREVLQKCITIGLFVNIQKYYLNNSHTGRTTTLSRNQPSPALVPSWPILIFFSAFRLTASITNLSTCKLYRIRVQISQEDSPPA